MQRPCRGAARESARVTGRSERPTDGHNHSIQEVTIMKKTKKSTSEKQAPVEQTAAAAEESTPKAVTKTGKKAARRAVPKSKRTADAVMPKAKSDGLCVFAFRLSAQERDEIHDAAGPARASRFVRALALAAARRDVEALQAILLETQREATH